MQHKFFTFQKKLEIKQTHIYYFVFKKILHTQTTETYLLLLKKEDSQTYISLKKYYFLSK